MLDFGLFAAIENNLVLEVGVEPTWPVKAAGF